MQVFFNYFKEIFIVVLILLVCLLFVKSCNDSKVIDEHNKTVYFNKVLGDSVKMYKDKNDKIHSEKLVLIMDKNIIKSNYNKLSNDYKDLTSEYDKNKKTISALNFTVEKLKKDIVNLKGVVDTTNHTVVFEDSSLVNSDSSLLNYKITIRNIQPIKNKQPELDINYLKTIDKFKVVTKIEKNGDVKTDIVSTDSTNKITKINSTVNDKVPDAVEEKTIKRKTVTKLIIGTAILFLTIGLLL